MLMAKSYSWTNTTGFSVSYKSSFTVGVPELGLGGSVEIGTEFNASFSRGGGSSETVEAEATGTTTVAPNSQMKALLTVDKVKMDLNFTFRQRLNYSNNTIGYREGTGVYKNVVSRKGEIKFVKWP